MRGCLHTLNRHGRCSRGNARTIVATKLGSCCNKSPGPRQDGSKCIRFNKCCHPAAGSARCIPKNEDKSGPFRSFVITRAFPSSLSGKHIFFQRTLYSSPFAVCLLLTILMSSYSFSSSSFFRWYVRVCQSTPAVH